MAPEAPDAPCLQSACVSKTRAPSAKHKAWCQSYINDDEGSKPVTHKLCASSPACCRGVTVMGCLNPAILPLLRTVASASVSAYFLTSQRAVVSAGLEVLSFSALNKSSAALQSFLNAALSRTTAQQSRAATRCEPITHSPCAPCTSLLRLEPHCLTLSCLPQTVTEDAAPLPPVRGHLLPPVHRRLPAAAPQVPAEPAPALLQALRQPAGAPAAPAGRSAAACPLCMPPCASCCSQQGGCWPLGCTSLVTGQLGLRCRVASHKLEQCMALGANLHNSRGSCRS